MKKFTPVLLMGLLTLTACNTAEADHIGPYETIDQLTEAIDTKTELECEWQPLTFSVPDDREHTWDASRCSSGSVVHHHRGSDSAKEWILDNLIEKGYTKTRIALGDDWIFVGDRRQAHMVRDGLEGKQPNIKAPAPTAAPTLSPTSSPSFTSTPSPSPRGPAFEITCRDDEWHETGEATSYEEAWDELSQEERVDCTGAWMNANEEEAVERYDFSQLEREALEIAEYRKKSIPLLYGLCAETHIGDHDGDKRWSKGQRAEAEGALLLCPQHPERDVVEARIAEADEADIQREEGARFGNGTYRVGEDIQPGTYVLEVDEAFDGCYWERLNASGNIIENNFISSGFRAQVTVAASDYSFSSERCGEWVKQ